jgi:hypothetical protein
LDAPLLCNVLGSAKQEPHPLGGIRRKIFRWAHKKVFWSFPKRHGYYIFESEMVLVVEAQRALFNPRLLCLVDLRASLNGTRECEDAV